MKKEYIASIGIAALSVGFVTICILLYFNKHSKWLTARKIKLGALMLTLSATMISCSGGEEEIMCYSQAVDDSVWIEMDTIQEPEYFDTNSPEQIDIIDSVQ